MTITLIYGAESEAGQEEAAAATALALTAVQRRTAIGLALVYWISKIARNRDLNIY